ncbi:hypothetical protein [Rodentibacter caecimuris]|uniref:hypothetical protein n=1 Tax=Rodentibacter caecimuris TaxID=1796644 RepID=UPI00258F1203|nr:hypothetical protein [Rodentibacter heylii]
MGSTAMIDFKFLNEEKATKSPHKRIDLSLIPTPTPKGIIELKYLQAAVFKGVEVGYIVNRKIIDEMYGLKCQTIPELF